MKHNIINKA